MLSLCFLQRFLTDADWIEKIWVLGDKMRGQRTERLVRMTVIHEELELPGLIVFPKWFSSTGRAYSLLDASRKTGGRGYFC